MLLRAPLATRIVCVPRPGPGRPCARRRANTPVGAFRDGAEQRGKKLELDTVEVRITLEKKVPFGHEIVVSGSAGPLGGWVLDQAVPMTWSEGDRWHATVALPTGAAVEFKFVQCTPDRSAMWESCLNRTLCVDEATADLSCVWSAPLATVVHPSPAAQQLAEMISGGGEDGVTTSDEDAPAPAFKPAAALALFADAVKQSLSGAGAGETPVPQAGPGAGAAAPAAPAASAPSTLLAAAAEVLSAERFDPLSPPPRAPTPKPVHMSAEAEAAVSSIIDAAGPTSAGVAAAVAPPSVDSGAEGDDEEEQAAAAVSKPAGPPTAAPPSDGGTALKTIGKVAGTVAMGVGAAAMLSAFAVDMADVAVLGAMAAGSVAAMSTPSGSKASKKKGRSSSHRSRAKQGAADEEGDVASVAAKAAAREVETEMISQKASAPGIILAASVLSAIDVGKKMLSSSTDEDDASSDESSGSDGTTKRQQK